MNFVIDMNCPDGWVEFLTGAGFTAVHWSEEGPPNAPDAAVLQWAAERGYVVLTAGWDGTAFDAVSRQPGVLLMSGGALLPDTLGGAVLAAIRDARTDLERGAVITIGGADARSAS